MLSEVTCFIYASKIFVRTPIKQKINNATVEIYLYWGKIQSAKFCKPFIVKSLPKLTLY